MRGRQHCQAANRRSGWEVVAPEDCPPCYQEHPPVRPPEEGRAGLNPALSHQPGATPQPRRVGKCLHWTPENIRHKSHASLWNGPQLFVTEIFSKPSLSWFQELIGLTIFLRFQSKNNQENNTLIFTNYAKIWFCIVIYCIQYYL